ncbi:MAG: hypothetical protein AB8B78_01740 [Polaribacter sp.]
MKRILLILVLFSTTIVLSQKKIFEKEVSKISKKIEKITKTQKDSLKMKVLAIDKQLGKGEITKTTADTLKKEVASYHARRIEKLVSEQELLLQKLVQDKANGKMIVSEESESINDDNDDENTFTIGNKVFRLNIGEGNQKEREQRRKKKWRKKNKTQRSTTTQFVFAMGINNVLNDDDLNSLNNSEYQLWRSRFYEVGWTWKTRFSRRPSQLYFKYGVSFLWNNLRLEGNRIHVKNGNTTEIQTFGNQLSDSRLRHVQMNFPVHLEWDFSRNRTYDDGFVRDRTNKSVRLGIGGFIGFKLGTRQYLEYKDANNVSVEEVQFDNFNMNTVNYGLSAYLGYRSTSFYVKYDLNPLFKNTQTRNISMGIRLDLD